MSGSERPLLTLALSTWNHARYVEQALQAALAQDYSPLEIIVSDDASSDDTFDIVQRMAGAYRGPHSLRLNRNDRNLGVAAHNDLLLGLVQGEMVVLSAGDDIDAPGRVSAVAAAWQADPAHVFCIAGPVRAIDENGQTGELIEPCTAAAGPDAAGLARTGEAVLGASLAVHKRLLSTFGPLGPGLRTCEDIVLPFRAALLGRIAVLPEATVNYRRHGASLMGSSGPLARNAEEFRAGFLRMVQGRVAARDIQRTDLDQARRLGLIDDAQHDAFAAALAERRAGDQLYLDLLQRRRGSGRRLMRRVVGGEFGIRDAARMMLMAACPASWFRYQRWRLGRQRATSS